MLRFLVLVAALPALVTTSVARSRQRRLHSRAFNYHLRSQHTSLRGGSHVVRGSIAGPAEQIEEWQDHDRAVHSTLSDKSLLELAQPVTTELYSKELHNLVDNQDSRFVTHQGNAATASYIKKQLKDMGLDVSVQTVQDPRIEEQYEHGAGAALNEMPDGTHENIIAYMKGGDLAHEVVLVGAHYDSVNWEDTAAEAPGVDDNGSGTALLLSVARALTAAGEKFRPRRSLLFVAFNAEEEGLVGSEHFARSYKENGRQQYGDLKAAFIADEVAWPGRGKDRRMTIFETKGSGEETNAMVDTLAKYAMIQNATHAKPGDGLGDGSHNFVVNYNGFGSDHISFLDNGFPAVLLIERDDDYHADTWGHSSRDTFDHVDVSFGAAVTRLALRAVAGYATPTS